MIISFPLTVFCLDDYFIVVRFHGNLVRQIISQVDGDSETFTGHGWILGVPMMKSPFEIVELSLEFVFKPVTSVPFVGH